MEKWSVYDIDRIRKTDKEMIRGHKFDKGDYHLVVHICVFNSQNQMLIQQRHKDKEGWSGMWDVSAAGSAILGENSREAAHRELFEEIGLDFNFTDIRPYFTINFSFGFDDYYLLKQDVDIKTLKLQEDEVQDIRWANYDEIINMWKGKIFVPYHKSMIDMMFQMKDFRGSLKRDFCS